MLKEERVQVKLKFSREETNFLNLLATQSNLHSNREGKDNQHLLYYLKLEDPR